MKIAGETLSLLNQSANPLLQGLKFVASLPSGGQQTEVLLEILLHFGQDCNAEAIKAILSLAQGLSPSAGQELRPRLESLRGKGIVAAEWMDAALLEASGCHAEAAAVLRDLRDADWRQARPLRLVACARNLLKASDPLAAQVCLRDAAKVARSYNVLCSIDRLLGRIRSQSALQAKRECRVALLGNTTLDLLAPALRAACFGAGIDAEVYVGPFGQHQQEILDPSSSLAAFKPQVVILMPDWRSLGLPDDVADPSGLWQAKVAQLRGLWKQCRDRLGAFVIQHDFEVPPADPYGRLSAALPGGRASLLHRINLGLWEAAHEESGVAILDLDHVAAVYGKNAWHDPVMWLTAKQYPAADAIPLLVRRQVALLRASLGLTAKCLVLDLDGTIWGGVIGEDGMTGIELGGTALGEAFQAFQRYAKSLAQRGIILAVCSKNNEADALQPFREHPEMILRLEDIAMFVANWQPKDENLKRIAETLNIGLDSLVFVEDSPVERSYVRQRLPEVEVPELPADPSLFVRVLDEEMYFEAISMTGEDLRRTESYRQNVQRKLLERASGTLEEFLASLQMKVQLKPFVEADVPRITQLINKTNQFNLTTRRMSETQVRGLIGNPQCFTLSLRMSDRFGDSGLTGVLIALRDGENLRIDNWLMSCRVLGRRLEEAMLHSVWAHAAAQGATAILGEYIPTAKNVLVKDLYDRLGFERILEGPDGERKYKRNTRGTPLAHPDCFEIEDLTQR